MSILPGPAVLSFTSVIILTMLAAMVFDPRLLWDKKRGLSNAVVTGEKRVIEENKNVENLRRVRFNSIWLVPLVAIMVAGWMLYQNWASQGPVITLIAPNAEGLEAGQTKLKARNVDVGKVIGIRLSNDYDNAIITVRMK